MGLIAEIIREDSYQIIKSMPNKDFDLICTVKKGILKGIYKDSIKLYVGKPTLRFGSTYIIILDNIGPFDVVAKAIKCAKLLGLDIKDRKILDKFTLEEAESLFVIENGGINKVDVVYAHPLYITVKYDSGVYKNIFDIRYTD